MASGGGSRDEAVQPSANPSKVRILNAAVEEFAAVGFAAVRIDRVAERARCNKQLIYYYFSSKAGLYDAVFEHMMAVAGPRWATMQPTSFRDLLVAQLGWLTDSFERRWLRLLVMEGLEEGSEEDHVARHEPERREIWQRSVEFVRDRQAADEIDSDFDPEIIALLFGLTSASVHVFPQMVRMVTGLNPTDPQFTERMGATLSRLIDAMAPASDDTTEPPG